MVRVREPARRRGLRQRAQHATPTERMCRDVHTLVRFTSRRGRARCKLQRAQQLQPASCNARGGACGPHHFHVKQVAQLVRPARPQPPHRREQQARADDALLHFARQVQAAGRDEVRVVRRKAAAGVEAAQVHDAGRGHAAGAWQSTEGVAQRACGE